MADDFFIGPLRLNADSIPVGPYQIITKKEDFPTPVGGVITLEEMTSWLILADVDLEGDRLACDGICAIWGASPETCKIRSTGLAGDLITSADTLTLRDIGLYSNPGHFAVVIDGTGATYSVALDWFGVNFNEGATDDATRGAASISNIGNSVNQLIGVFAGTGFVYDGSIGGTIAFSNTIFVTPDGATGVKVEPTCTINGRIRLGNCALINTGAGSVSTDVPKATVVDSEGFILDFCRFSGPGTYVTGTTEQDDEARWSECRGIINTTRLGEMTMTGNATATTINTIGVFERMAGTTTAGSFNQHFSHASNQLTYTSALQVTFKITLVASLLAANNRQIMLQAYLNGVTPIGVPFGATTNGVGRAENVSWQGIVQLTQNDYIELWVANDTDTGSVTVEDLSFVARQ